MTRRLLSLLAVLLCLVAAGWAQERTGSIMGSVTDPSGAAIPNASIEVTSPALGRTLKLTSDARGEYLALNLPPGAYTVTASAKGFAAARVADVPLPVGRSIRVNLKLEVSAVAETVVVTGEVPLVDTQSSKTAVNILRQEIDLIPRGRSFQDLTALAPGVQQEPKAGGQGMQIDGASSSENVWIIDGVDSTSLRTGDSAKDLLNEWVQEVQVKTSGFEAEYGGALGGVVNVVSRSGGNEAHGELNYYYWGSKLSGYPRKYLRINPADNKTVEWFRWPAKDRSTTTEVGFDIGGPIVKNKLWYFVGYQPRWSTSERNVFFVVPQVSRQYQWRSSTQSWTAKLSVQPWDRLRTNLSVTQYQYKTIGGAAGIEGTGNPDTDYSRLGNRQPNVGYSGDAYLSLTSKLFFNFRLSYFLQDQHDVGVPKAIRYIYNQAPGASYLSQIPTAFQQLRGWSNIATNDGVQHDTYTRLTGNTDANLFGHWLGDHNIKVGYQVNRLGNDVKRGSLDDRIYFEWDQTYNMVTKPGQLKGKYGYYWKYFFGVLGKVNSYNHGLFVQDSWAVHKRLRLSLGLRSETEFIPGYRGPTGEAGTAGTAFEFPWSQKLSPRVGFAYDVFGNNRSKLYGSFGLYYDLMKYELSRGSFGGDSYWTWYWTLDTLDIGSIGHGNYPGTFGEVVDWRIPSNAPVPELGGMSLLDPDIRPMRSRKFDIGWDQMVGQDWTLHFRYARERLDRTIEDVGILGPAGEQYFITNPGYGLSIRGYGPTCDTKVFGADCRQFPATPKAERRYDAFELRAQRRLAKRWQSTFTYTFAYLEGNYSGLASTDENGRQDPNVNRYFDLPYLYVDAKGKNIDGPLPTERHHTLKYYGSYSIPIKSHSFSIGGVFTAGSGIPYTRQIQVVSSTPMFVENRASEGRRSEFSLTNIYLQQDFKLSERTRLLFSFQLDNLFNQATANNYDAYYGLGGASGRLRAGLAGSPLVKNYQYTQGFDYQAQIKLQANLNRPATCGSFESDPYCPTSPYRLNPLFMKPSWFRGPIGGRLGIRLIF